MKVGYEICQFNIAGAYTSGDSAAAEMFPEVLCKATAGGKYTDEKLYSCNKTALYYKLLPNKSLELTKAPSKAGIKTNKKKDKLSCCLPVRLAIASRNDCALVKVLSPRCFKHVNIKALPVIYKNSSCSWMPHHTSASWFENQFVP